MRKEYDFAKLKAVRNPYVNNKKAVGINLSPKASTISRNLPMRRACHTKG